MAHIMPFGTHIEAGGGVSFRLWAPGARKVDLCLEEPAGERSFFPMRCLTEGWYHAVLARTGPGTLYRFRIDDGLLVPDPVSRCQADDVHGPSQVVDPDGFPWQDQGWRGRAWEEAVIYELHVGAFSPAGNFAGVAERLDYLADLGITALELMPVADFPGQRGWGYDGVLLFAPHRAYGRPEELKSLIQAAHARRIMVFLDVVYNHFGPEGNYLHVYAKEAFFTARHRTPWGDAIDFSGARGRAVRDFFIHNALYWLEEYHLDGLRLDAVHAIRDDCRPDILEEIAEAVRQGPGRDRHIHLILENDDNNARYLARSETGSPKYFVAQWNDDIHHACHVLLTGEREGYYQDYGAAPLRHLGRCLTEGFAYQGEPSPYRDGAPRGEPSDHLPLTAFVSFLQNHDQVGNRALGERLTMLAGEAGLRVATALLLLAPSPPLLFMGEEFGAKTPFLFFCDFGAELAGEVAAGRRQEFARFAQFQDAESRLAIPDPCAASTFQRSMLDWDDAQQPAGRDFLARYRKILRIRSREIAPRLTGLRGGASHYRIIGPQALRVRWILGDSARLSVLINFGAETVRNIGCPAGDLLYADPADSGAVCREGTVPPGSIAWFLEPPEP